MAFSLKSYISQFEFLYEVIQSLIFKTIPNKKGIKGLNTKVNSIFKNKTIILSLIL